MRFYNELEDAKMNVYAGERVADAGDISLESQTRDYGLKDGAPIRRVRAAEASESAVTKVNSLVERVAGTSLQEIDDLVVEMQNLRVFLVGEGERLQRELANYAKLNKATQRSAKIIAESLPNWKVTADASSGN
jgi:hypothetical protein